MLQRTRSASLPKDVGDFIFIGDSDFHSDVYDDTANPGDTRTDRRDSPTPLTQESDTAVYSSDVLMRIFLVVSTGALSSIIFELLLRVDPDSALLSALFLHIWTVVIAIPHSYQYIISPKIPYYWHLVIVLLSFSFLFLKSFAIKMLPMPLLIVCSNLQLVFGLLVGKGLFKKTFSIGQYIGVVVITIGCIIITLSSSQKGATGSSDKSATDIFSGICFITASISAIAIMIPTGSMLVQRYNADVQEQIFLQHFFALPLFAMQADRLIPCMLRVYNATESYSVGSFNIPIVLVLLFGTTVFAQINRYLTMEISISISPLASQLVNAVNKTIVLLVSMLYFNAPPYPTMFVWLGVAAQTAGSVAYVKSSYSDTSAGNFKPNKRKSRFSRVSWNGSCLNITEKDITHLRQVADASRRNKMRRVTSDSLMSTPFYRKEDMRRVNDAATGNVTDQPAESATVREVSSPHAKTRRPAFSSTDYKKNN